jgi:cytochrome b6-f complex subunit 5
MIPFKKGSLVSGYWYMNASFEHNKESFGMVEPLLSGIVLGLIPITLAGLFVTAYLQYRRGDQLDL